MSRALVLSSTLRPCDAAEGLLFDHPMNGANVEGLGYVHKIGVGD